jgi:hypothetical protein
MKALSYYSLDLIVPYRFSPKRQLFAHKSLKFFEMLGKTLIRNCWKRGIIPIALKALS